MSASKYQVYIRSKYVLVYAHPSLHLLEHPIQIYNWKYILDYLYITQSIMSYSHKSGSQKRHEKRLKEIEIAKASRTLLQVGIKQIF